VFGPSWWAGFFAGVGLCVAALDFGTWEATRRHRGEERPWKDGSYTTLAISGGSKRVVYDQQEGGGEL